jgi:signal transduction histidine kinase
MTGIWHSRNFWRLFITYGLLVVTSIGVLGTVLVNQVEQSFLTQTEGYLRERAKVVREAFRGTTELDLRLPEAVDGSLSKRMQYVRETVNLHVAVLDQNGKVLRDSQRAETGGEDYSNLPEIQAADSGRLIGVDRRPDGEFSNREIMYLARRMNDPKCPVGYVRVGLSLESIAKTLDDMRETVWTTAAITAAVAVLLAFWLAQRTAKPLQALTRGAERIAAGQFGHKVKAVSQDEVGQLGRAFNRMSDHLAEQFTQLVDDREKLRRLEALRRDFVANVSHELKTPLAVIKACVETLLDGAADDPTVSTSFLQQVAEQADHLQALIFDLLSLARVESGAEVFEFQPVALGEIARGCVERHRARAEGKNQQLETGFEDKETRRQGDKETEDSEVTAWADEEAVSQILDNLVDNALKYTPDGGRIRVRWWAEGREACVEVTDTGIGIPEGDLPRVFERFYRVDKARSRELGGTGLGLAIVKHLVQAMHGSVQAGSRPGQGSTFTVRLPEAAVSRPPHAATAEAAANAR